MSVMLLE